MTLFVSQFHLLAHRRGIERTMREKAAAEEKKQLHHEKMRKHEACQKHGVLPSDNHDDDDDEDVEDEDEDLVVLDAPQGFGDATGPSGTGYSVGTLDGSAT